MKPNFHHRPWVCKPNIRACSLVLKPNMANCTISHADMSMPHGVFIWLTASIRFQHCSSLKTSPHCQPDGPEQGTQPSIPSIQRLQASPHMARRPVGTLREHCGRGHGVMPRPLTANRHSSLCHCSPPFTMIRTSFAGWRFRSLLTCAVVISGCRAHIHMPNDLATIIADITFRSHRRVNTSSW